MKVRIAELQQLMRAVETLSPKCRSEDHIDPLKLQVFISQRKETVAILVFNKEGGIIEDGPVAQEDISQGFKSSKYLNSRFLLVLQLPIYFVQSARRFPYKRQDSQTISLEVDFRFTKFHPPPTRCICIHVVKRCEVAIFQTCCIYNMLKTLRMHRASMDGNSHISSTIFQEISASMFYSDC